MLHRIELSDLLTPVMQRVQADLSNAIKGFSDRSAAFVLQQFGIKPHAYDYSPLNQKTHKGEIARCAWIDQQLRQFFEKEPDAEGIEVSGGLSTRFHRLSEQLDWPQFAWSSINTFDVNDWLEFVFPAIDNYQNIGCSNPRECWQKYVHWREKRRKILVIGEQRPLESWKDFDALYSTIQFALTDQTPTIDLIITHKIPDFLPICTSKQVAATPVAEQPQRKKPRSWLGQILSLILQPRKDKATSIHLRITQRS